MKCLERKISQCIVPLKVSLTFSQFSTIYLYFLLTTTLRYQMLRWTGKISICCSFNSISSAKQKSHWTLKSNSPHSSIILSWWRFESSCKRMFSNVHGSIQVFWGMDMKTLTLLELSQLPKLSPLSSICSHIQKGLHSFSLQSRHTYQLLNS